MSRSLRPRTSRPSYSFEYEESNEINAGPSTKPLDDDLSSGSEFTPEAEAGTKSHKSQEFDVDDEKEEDELISDEDLPLTEAPSVPKVRMNPPPAKPKGKGKAKKSTGPAPSVVKLTTSKPTTLSGTFRRQMYILPTPSIHHRHRAVPLYSVPGRVERLVSPPVLFSTPDITLTNNFTLNAKLVDRLNKAWGYNVGSGPLWELIEDRGWFKEAQGRLESEHNRRPKVHENVPVQNGWDLLNAEDAAVFLPTDDVTTEDGQFRSPPSIPCYFGPFGSQTFRATQMFQTIKMADYIPNSASHVFNAGAPVWGLDWCPLHPDTREEYGNIHYLAVGPLPSPSHSPEIGVRVERPSGACIQIWSLSPEDQTSTGNSAPQKKTGGSGRMRCDMVICVDSGPAYELKWCPLPSPSARTTSTTGPSPPRKLGLLSGTFEDGSFAIFAIPDPTDVAPIGHDFSHPVYIRLPEPLLRIEMEETCCWSIDWANSDVVGIGMTNGNIGIFHVGSVLREIKDANSPPVTDLLPTHYFTVHQTAIRALAWIRAPTSYSSGEPRFDEDPMIIASGGYDGVVCLTNVRSGHGSVMNRTRDVINSMAYSAYGAGPVTIDHDDAVKAYSASPKMLGRGHMLMEPQGPVWSIAASDYHPQLAVGSADGTCTTTNLLRSTRRGGSVPFFVHKVYQMDYNRTTKEYRMLEQFFPQESQDRGAANNPKNFKLKNTANDERGTGVWPKGVGVQRVVWNSGNGLGGTGILASATGAGLCRVDVLSGRWMKEKTLRMPYGGIENIRLEREDDMDVNSDEGST